MDGRLSSIKVLFLLAFLQQDGGGANAGQRALEMSPGTSTVSVCSLKDHMLPFCLHHRRSLTTPTQAIKRCGCLSNFEPNPAFEGSPH